MRTRTWISALCAALTASIASADEPRTAVVEPGRRYGMGWLGRFSLGSQWRDLWTTPIEVAVLDLGSFDGGLTPVGEGGGMETHSLHLKSGNGRHWVFRSVDKDPKKALSPDARESLIGALAQDLTSTENPAGALITAPPPGHCGRATRHASFLPDAGRLASGQVSRLV